VIPPVQELAIANGQSRVGGIHSAPELVKSFIETRENLCDLCILAAPTEQLEDSETVVGHPADERDDCPEFAGPL
jgi:hypothetical protein